MATHGFSAACSMDVVCGRFFGAASSAINPLPHLLCGTAGHGKTQQFIIALFEFVNE